GCTYLERAVNIPPVFQCYTPSPCADCRVVDSLYHTFKNTYGILPALPEEDSLQRTKNDLFAAFMNNRLGYGLSVVDYLKFMDSCQVLGYRDTVVTDQASTITFFQLNTGKSLLRSVADPVALNATVLDMKRTRDGGFIMAGYTSRPNNQVIDKALLIKASSNGQPVWIKTYDAGDGDDRFVKILEMANGDLLAGGVSNNRVPVNEWATYSMPFASLLRLNAKGDVLWSKGIYSGDIYRQESSGDDIRDIAELSNGDIAFSGTYNVYQTSCDWTVGVVSQDGNMRWLRRMGTAESELGQAIVEDEKSLVMAGLNYTSSGRGGSRFNANLVRLDKERGDILGNFNYDVGSKLIVNGLYKLPSGSFRLAMVKSVDPNLGSLNGQGMVMDVDRDGFIQRAFLLSRILNADTYWLSGAQLSDGSMLLSPSLSETDNGLYLMKVNADGGLSWSRRLQDRSAGSGVRNIFQYDSSIYAGGNFGMTPALFTYRTNGLAACNDAALEVSVAPFKDAFSGSLNLSVNELVGNNTFDFTLEVNDLPAVVNKVYCESGESLSLYRGPLLCGQTGPSLEAVPLNTTNNCSDSTFYLVNTSTELYKALTDSLKNDFNASYLNSCMQAASGEVFTMTHALSEYHYTLYYYDQAGNLVKTVPPAGVVSDHSDGWLSR
ncbi:hypothetical protein ACDQ55_21630, partial [Chitinophaga sp. 30R24]|uniref:hypothetical protein n=1 Tax=Chitinophaga sp. 30R24 TaxID=3248838 RepID=UPI003B9043E5